MKKEYICCNNPHYKLAYVPCKPFKAKYCTNCNEVILDCNPIIEWIFEWIFSPFWNGSVYLPEEERGI